MPAVTANPPSGWLDAVRAAGRERLLESEGYELLRLLGIGVPGHVVVPDSRGVADLDLEALPGHRVVVKALLPSAYHKTELGAVVEVPKEPPAVAAAVERLERRLRGRDVAGYIINEFVPHDDAPGAQLLVGLRWTADFGPVVTVGPGGVTAELLTRSLRPETGVAVFTPVLGARERIARGLDGSFVNRFVTRPGRDGRQRATADQVIELVECLLAFAARTMPADIAELEVNPLVFTAGGAVALDVLVRLGSAPASEPAPRPLAKLRHLLTPHSIAVVGVSQGENPGRTIVENVLRAGFDPARLAVVKPGVNEIAGVRCFPHVRALPEPVDLMVLSIAATGVPDALREIVERRKAESVILIPGGIGERAGTGGLEAEIRSIVRDARQTSWGGPVINGGNCLGIRSEPGRYDTMFLPQHKVWSGAGHPAPLALIAQSGAFAAARSGKLGAARPRYLVSVGNQTDLTVGDYLTYLQDDPEISVFACYVEGFQPLDGQRWLDAAAHISASGRTVLLYRGGRTEAGAAATRSHTAAVAGDYVVTRALAREAGVVVADGLADFDDLLRLFVLLGNAPLGGWRLGAISNAGFECVTMADRLGRFHLARFAPETVERLKALFRDARVDGIVDVRNPLDLTPAVSDAPFSDAVRVVLDDPYTDVGVVGCVPLTGALDTLTAADHHRESTFGHRAIAARLSRLRQAYAKPWVAVVDAGSLYDPMAAMLDEHGVPTFRTADRALAMLELYCEERQRIRELTTKTRAP